MLKLSDREWKEFAIEDIFILKKGFYNKRPKKEEDGIIPFLSATESNNGISDFFSLKNIDISTRTGDTRNEDLTKKIFKGNCICVTNNGSVGHAYYQSSCFTCSHDINPLYLKHRKLNRSLALFLIRILEIQGKNFEYSRKWRPIRMKRSKVFLPVDPNNEPDYDFMEAYIRQEEEKLLKQYREFIKEIEEKEIPELKDKEWKEFRVTDIFNRIQRGRRLTKNNQKAGNVPYVSSSFKNNGVDNFISNKESIRVFDNCLSLANSGSVGTSFYEPFEFIASDHITHLKNERFNKFHYLFLSLILEKEMKPKYSFNREINDKRIKKEKILLPINDQGEPDYGYMEQYAKNIIARQYRDYLTYLEKRQQKSPAITAGLERH